MTINIRGIGESVNKKLQVSSVANTIAKSPDVKQTLSGYSFSREPNELPFAEAGYYRKK